jgi:hypothetical protein
MINFHRNATIWFITLYHTPNKNERPIFLTFPKQVPILLYFFAGCIKITATVAYYCRQQHKLQHPPGKQERNYLSELPTHFLLILDRAASKIEP